MDRRLQVRIKKLAAELSAIPELPEAPMKTAGQRLAEVAADIAKFKDWRESLVGRNIEEFDRFRFESAKRRLIKQLEELEQEGGVETRSHADRD